MLVIGTKEIAEFNGFFGQLPCDWAEHIELEDVYVTEEDAADGSYNIKLYYYDVVVARSNCGPVDDDLYEDLIGFISATIADNYTEVEYEEPEQDFNSEAAETKSQILAHLQVMRDRLCEFDANETVGLLIEIDNLAAEVEAIGNGEKKGYDYKPSTDPRYEPEDLIFRNNNGLYTNVKTGKMYTTKEEAEFDFYY